MIYLYAVVIPILILGAHYIGSKIKPTTISGLLSLILKSLPSIWGYVFFLYYMERENKLRTGWADLGLATFLIPITIIVALLRLFYWIKAFQSKCSPPKGKQSDSTESGMKKSV